MTRLRTVAAAVVLGLMCASMAPAAELCDECAPVYWEIQWLEDEMWWLNIYISGYESAIAYEQDNGGDPAHIAKMQDDMEADKLYRLELEAEAFSKAVWLGECTICN